MASFVFGFVYLLFNVTFSDIPVIFVTTRRCAGGLTDLNLRPKQSPEGQKMQEILVSLIE